MNAGPCSAVPLLLQGTDHLSWAFALLGAKGPSENLPLRCFITPRKRVVKVLCPLPHGHSSAKRVRDRALRDKKGMQDLALLHLRSLKVYFISLVKIWAAGLIKSSPAS